MPEPAPNIYISGPLLDGKFVVYDGTDPARPALGTGVPRADDAEAAVAALQEAGADFIKIYELVHPQTYQALVTAARARDMPIASHVPLMMTADTAGPLADSMEHLRNIELACAENWQELLNRRRNRINEFTEGLGHTLRAGLHSDQRIPAIQSYDEQRCDQVLDTLTTTIQVPTLRLNTVAHLRPFEKPDWPTALAELPTATQLAWQARIEGFQQMPAADPTFSDWSLFLIQRLLARGVPIGAGTDTPIGFGIPGYSLHTELELLVIDFQQDRMTLRIPVGKARNSGLRRLSTRKQMDNAIEKLKGRARVRRTMWSRRAQEYEAKINSGDPISIAEVVRDLRRNTNQGDQSFSERQMYQAALDRLAREFAAIEKIDEQAAADRLERIMTVE